GFRAQDCHRLLDREIGGLERRRQRRRVAGAAFPELQERSVASDAHANRLTRAGVLPDVDERVLGFLFGLLDRVLEPAMVLVAAVELLDEIDPLALAARDLIEVL